MATISGTIVTIDAVWSCISHMLLESGMAIEAMANWSGSSLAPIFTGVTHAGEPFAHTEMSHFGGGGGARTYRDGVDTAGIVFNTTPNIPNIETNEQDLPVLYLFRRNLIDSGGPGRFRGGMAGELAYVPHKQAAAMEGLFAGTGCYMPNALGLAGGLPGSAVLVARVVGSTVLARLQAGEPLPVGLEGAGGKIELLEPKHARSPLGTSDIWYHSWQGGAGYGDPLDRDPAAVLADVRNLAVSQRVAHTIYGVEIAGDEVDDAATHAVRERLLAERLEHETNPLPAVPSDGGPVSEHPVAGSRSPVVCSRCGENGGGWAAVIIEDSLDAAGPRRGQDYGDRGFRLQRFVCSSCAAQLDVKLVYRGDRLVEPPRAPAEEIPYPRARRRVAP
jgi:N-methylhydantoinase B